MEVLLINPPWVIRKANIWREVAGVIPPLGLAQVAAFVEKAGVKAEIIDAQAEGIGLDGLAHRLGKARVRPAYVGITATTSIAGQAYETARICKQVFPGAKTVLGGVHPSVFPDEALSKPFVDFVVRREGENSFLSLVSGQDPAMIPGLSFKSAGKAVHNPTRRRYRI